MQQDQTVARVLERLGDLENYPEESLAPYEEFRIDANIYYFTPGASSTARTMVPKRSGASFVATSPTRSGTIGPTTASKSLLTDCRGPNRDPGLVSHEVVNEP